MDTFATLNHALVSVSSVARVMVFAVIFFLKTQLLLLVTHVLSSV